MKWEMIPREEQETIINIDYNEKTISLYTTRYSVANKLKKRIGEPTKTQVNQGLITSVEYRMSMGDERVRKLLSLGAIILRPMKQSVQEDELD